MKGPLVLFLVLVVNVLEGKPSSRPPLHKKYYGMLLPHLAVPNCEGKLQCGSSHFTGFPECVPAIDACNGVPDCSNGADERGCAYPNCASLGMITCSNGKTCGKPCDGWSECQQLEDEMMCPKICPKGSFKCNDGKTCVSSDRIDDGHDDCREGDDENICNCDNVNQLRCSDGTCASVCDGKEECTNGADEQNCRMEESMMRVIICENGDGHLQCPAGKKIEIITANYGRTQDEPICPHPQITDLNCMASESVNIVNDACNNEQVCMLMARNSVFGDPCVGTFKYLDVEFRCVDA